MSRELNIVVDLSDWRAPKLSPWARRFLVAGALFALLAPEAGSQLEDVQLNTYFPAPSGIYQQLMTSGNAYFATTGAGAGSFVEIGSPGGSGTPTGTVGNNAALVVASGNVGVGVSAGGGTDQNATSYYFAPNQPGAGGGLRIGPYISGGQAQIELDNSNGSAGQINRWQNQLQLWATDQVAIGGNNLHSDSILYSNTGSDPTLLITGVSQISQMISGGNNLNYNDTGPYGGVTGNVPNNCYWGGGAAQAVVSGGGGCGSYTDFPMAYMFSGVNGQAPTGYTVQCAGAWDQPYNCQQ